MADTVEAVRTDNATAKLGALGQHYTESARLIRAVIHVEREQANNDLTVSFDKRQALEEQIRVLKEEMAGISYGRNTVARLEEEVRTLDQRLNSETNRANANETQAARTYQAREFLAEFARAIRKIAPSAYAKAKKAAAEATGYPASIALPR